VGNAAAFAFSVFKPVSIEVLIDNLENKSIFLRAAFKGG